MSYGISLQNNYGESVISETTLSLVTNSSGTLNYSVKSGDTVTATVGTAKGASAIQVPFPYSDELYGGVRKTLYFYDFDQFTPETNYFDFNVYNRSAFFNVGVNDHLILGGVNRKNPDDYSEILPYHGVFYTQPTLQWKRTKPRDKTVLPTGYGMAVYDSSGYCHWSMDDEIFSIPDVVRSFDPWVNYTWTSSFNGWVHCDIPYLFISVTGATPRHLYGRFERTSTGLDWKYNTKMTATNWGTSAERELLRNKLEFSWDKSPKPITGVWGPSRQALMLASA